MAHEHNFTSAPSEECLTKEQREHLLKHQHELQKEARRVLAELQITQLLSQAGTLRQVGSAELGLMVWRDIDLAISSPALSIERAYDFMRSLYIHPGVKEVSYFNQSGPFSLAGLAERYYFAVLYNSTDGHEWKLDISFWLGEGLHPEPIHEALERQLTEETREAILWIKDIWFRLPTYRRDIYSTDIYDAVLQHGVRTPGQFDSYLAARGKPTRTNKPRQTPGQD
ncbi:hypothetical protein EPA93_01975 [Ktedonosporobacter rubrisoli]|uniref:Nucleotidyltransferase family protein n=1 Tax=Ktedonosporobacter rubrisoli TaxID=2509675 RepID=A0A4P6JJI8_KTERU|nr:hypothetical protein [Ktedonosporobacter rubrisoli]QBD74826.1 hypothetical protein EPA93_01975 [Ktedonosporobacter rubrisoli]